MCGRCVPGRTRSHRGGETRLIDHLAGCRGRFLDGVERAVALKAENQQRGLDAQLMCRVADDVEARQGVNAREP